MTLYEYLRQHGEDLPGWLARHRPGDPFPRGQFLSSRVFYYPGSGTDGHPVRLFGSTHCAHCFVYADYGVSQAELDEQLADPHERFRGYHTLDRIQLRERDLVPHGWSAHVPSHRIPSHSRHFARTAACPFGFLEVLERDQELDDNHGACRLAVLFLGADGIATYDALFCQGQADSAPFAVLLQDHGFGGNFDKFGRDGLLQSIAASCQAFPPWLLVAENTDAWDGYERVPGVEGDRGGMHAMLRYLYRRRNRRGGAS